MTLGPDLALDALTHDLVFENGDAVMRANLAQAIKIRLLFFKNEWFLNTELGIPYFESVFKKAPNLDLARAAFRKAIAETPGVVRVNSVDVALDSARNLTVTWNAEGDSAAVSGVEVI